MAGHSKWSNTKYRKSVQDTKRGKIFSKIIREILSATKLGGENINFNPRLRTIINKALSNNMTKETINRAIYRVKNEKKPNEEKFICEGYGPNNTVIIIECLSNNRNQSIEKINFLFKKNRGKLNNNYYFSNFFKKFFVLSFQKETNEDFIMDIALKINANDVIQKKNGITEIYVPAENINKTKNFHEIRNINIIQSKLIMVPFNYVDLNSEGTIRLLKFIKEIKCLDFVKAVFHNGKI